jgi:hypothetical protein
VYGEAAGLDVDASVTCEIVMLGVLVMNQWCLSLSSSWLSYNWLSYNLAPVCVHAITFFLITVGGSTEPPTPLHTGMHTMLSIQPNHTHHSPVKEHYRTLLHALRVSSTLVCWAYFTISTFQSPSDLLLRLATWKRIITRTGHSGSHTLESRAQPTPSRVHVLIANHSQPLQNMSLMHHLQTLVRGNLLRERAKIAPCAWRRVQYV